MSHTSRALARVSNTSSAEVCDPSNGNGLLAVKCTHGRPDDGRDRVVVLGVVHGPHIDSSRSCPWHMRPKIRYTTLSFNKLLTTGMHRSEFLQTFKGGTLWKILASSSLGLHARA